jgi:molybdate transport system ATP-binding protein
MLEVSLRQRVGDFSLEVDWSSSAHVVALVGPSGSGKTLTLQCIAGLIAPAAGRVVAGGRVMFDSATRVDLPPQARSIGYVFQGYALFPHMTVSQNIAYGIKAMKRGDAAEAPQRRIRETIDRLGLGNLRDRYPAELSGGQQQRVALARALAPDPDLLLLDEPLSALDAPLRRELRAELAQTLRECAKPAVFVTHDLPEAYQIADVVVLYENGRATAATAKDRLLWNPSSERVARLIGARNILTGTVARAGGSAITIEWRGQRLEAASSPSHPLSVEVGDRLAFFVRPEYVRLLRKDRPSREPDRDVNRVTGDITGERDEGATVTLFFRLAGGGTPSQGEHDLEIEVPRLVYERLAIVIDRHWDVSIHPRSIQLLPAKENLFLGAQNFTL